MDEKFDVIIIGAGPGGGQCARDLSYSGKKVLLVEKVLDFSKNNFSSAGTPNETIEVFNLPDKVVAAKWDSLVFVTNNNTYEWKGSKSEGGVFDFIKLRTFLAEDAKQYGAVFLLGHTYISREPKDSSGYSKVVIKDDATNEEKNYFGKVIVDATGPSRKVIYKPGEFTLSTKSASNGLEYIIKVNSYKKEFNHSALYILVGSKWAPFGYSWIFPMGENKFKFGVGVDILKFRTIQKPLSYFVDLLLNEYIGEGNYEILDNHGGTVNPAENQNDKYYEDNVIAIGDAISTIFPLAGEGIRHAMHSGRIASKYILLYLDGNINDFEQYKKAMKKYFGIKWMLGKFLVRWSNGASKSDNNKSFDQVFTVMKKLSIKEMIDFFFYYKFQLFFKGILVYFFK